MCPPSTEAPFLRRNYPAHRYYEPLRHPRRPGLSLTSYQLMHLAITAGTSRVAYGPLCLHAVAITPAGLMEFVRSYDSISFGLPRNRGSCISLFEACLAFTYVTACTLAKSPSDSLHQRLQQFRCLHYCSDCYRVERTSSRAGIPPLWTSAFTAHPACPLIGTWAATKILEGTSLPTRS